MRINKKHERIIYTFLMALGMSLIISFILVSINHGFKEEFVITWLKLWGEAFVIAFPTAYYLPGGVRRIMKVIKFV